ncbi:hypothetical protein VNO77_42320 [Canavalia gladiata]|uniref:GTD-binding domain-containing protein n=1 Tax=Canavalia gladiata TaxID=3824 RepID=A0AAN9K0T4_CANGL
MATNKFATMLHKNTNKTIFVLVYAILEWILILLLLLNSIFSYLIIKFSDYFGLKRPCILCTRIDHILEPGNNKFSCSDLVCEAHASEISKLCFCLNHRKLADSETMCQGCLSSCRPNCVNLPQSFGFFSWMQQTGMNMMHVGDDDRVIENVVEPLRCSCCGVNFVSKFYLPCILDKPCLGVLDCTQKQNLITESGVEAEIDEGHHHHLDHGRDGFVLDHLEEEQNTVENRRSKMVFDDISVYSVSDGGKVTIYGENHNLDLDVGKGYEEPIREETLNVPKDDRPCDETTHQVACTEESTQHIQPKHLEFVIHGNDSLLIPVELGDSFATRSRNRHRFKVGDDGLSGGEDVILDFDINSGAEAAPVIENWHTSGDVVSVISGPENTNAFKVNGVESIPMRIEDQNSGLKTEEENLKQNYQGVKYVLPTEDSTSINGYVEANTERRDGELCSVVPLVSEGAAQMRGDELDAEFSTQNQDVLWDSNQKIQVSSSSTSTFTVQDDIEFKTMSHDMSVPTVNNHLESSLELNEVEEETAPDIPFSIENLHQLHEKLLLLGRKESGTEESLEGSFISDIESGELTIDKLKSALKAERKALKTLYIELEEERSASAVAANQTMAMINRLQEEKAAMRMEALQYHRMMEEQSEYDQEALQLLNELMIKREKERLEAEKELEIYRKKVHEYEVREKMMMSRRESNIRSGTSPPPCGNARDSDGLSIDLSRVAKEKNDIYSHQDFISQNTPESAVTYLEESLENFEEERNQMVNLMKERKPWVQKPRGFFHPFDAIRPEAENGVLSNGMDFTSRQNSSNEKVQLKKKKLDVEVEVDHVYERLQALEADREFLKHCISSLRKGDKGLDLIQEILQHLRNLRNVDLRIRNMGDIAV